MLKTFEHIKSYRRWQRKYEHSAPKVGELAPGFELRDVHGGNPVRLSDFREKKPVALIFGSFT